MQWVELMDWWGSCVGGFGGLVDLVDLVDWWIWWIGGFGWFSGLVDWWIGGSTCRGDREGVAQIQTVPPTGETFISYIPFFPHFEKKYMYKYFARFFVGSFSFMFFFCKLEYHLFITLLFRIWRIVTQTVICDSFFSKVIIFHFNWGLASKLKSGLSLIVWLGIENPPTRHHLVAWTSAGNMTIGNKMTTSHSPLLAMHKNHERIFQEYEAFTIDIKEGQSMASSL